MTESISGKALGSAPSEGGDAWISVEERLPPACTEVLVYGWSYADRPKRMRVFQSFINTRPRECVEDMEITHWMPLPAPPASGAFPSDAPTVNPGSEGSEPNGQEPSCGVSQ